MKRLLTARVTNWNARVTLHGGLPSSLKDVSITERQSANTRHAIADCDGSKAIATNECITTNTRIICRRGGVLE